MKKYIQMWFKCICMLTCCFLIVNTCPVYYHASDSGNDLSTVEDAALPEVSENNCVLTDVPESHDTEEGAFLENYPDSDDEESLVVETGSVANVSNDTDDGSEVYVPETIISDETSDDDSLQIQGASVEGSDSVLEITSEGVDLAEENYVTVAGSSENGVIASATSGSCGENASYTIDENEVCTITGTGEISAPYYTWCGVKKIIISEGITSIGENAFREYNNLYSFTEVVLPDTLVSIKSGAFFANRELESINFPEGLKEIADNSFGFCGLKTVVLPSTIEKIGDSAFAMLEKCTDFIIEDGASANADLHWQVVYGTDSLKRIVSPNCAFANMACRGAGTVEDSYTSITITKSFEKKFSYPYGDTHARHIDTLILGDDVTSIPNDACVGFSGLTNLDIGQGVTSIGARAFCNSSLLSEFYISQRVTHIGAGAFNKNTTIVGYFGTEAERYASRDGLHFLPVDSTNLSQGSIVVNDYPIFYDGSEKTPNISVKYNVTTLRKDTDYTVVYSNNVNQGLATIKVIGQGKYYGELQTTFPIYWNISNAILSISTDSITYDGTRKQPGVTVAYNGSTLSAGRDYTVEYMNNVEPGTAYVTITGIGNYRASKTKAFTISPISITNADIQLKQNKYIYDGSPKYPSVLVYYNGNLLVRDVDYLVSYKNNIDDGTAYVIVSGINHFKDTVEAGFLIVQERVTITKNPEIIKPKVKKNKAVVSWKKIKKTKKTKALRKQIQGIELQYSTDLSFPAENSVKIPLGKKKTKFVLKGLQKGTAYYIRVRYTDGAGGYSNWSGVKRVMAK